MSVYYTELNNDQQDKSSPDYHRWLTPEEFGERFGPVQEDIDVIVAWLESYGFRLNNVAPGRRSIEFSGTAKQVHRAFHTEMHKYVVNAKTHWANANDPQIPAALARVVGGIVSLHNFLARTQHQVLQRPADATDSDPTLTSSSQSCQGHCITPYDFATIYDVLPLWYSGTDGTDVHVAIVGRSNIDINDVRAFRSVFGLPANDPQIVLNGPAPTWSDPNQAIDEEREADLDTEWAGAVARGAKITLVVSASTNSSDGAALSSRYVVQNNLAPIMSVSFGLCESTAKSSTYTPTQQNALDFYNQEWQQAAAQGISVFVASGDSGSAGCDLPYDSNPRYDPKGTNITKPASGGLAVNGIASTQYNVAVGGTQFNENGNDATYWNSTNSTNTYASATGYIPEVAWNESCYSGYSFASGTQAACPQVNNFNHLSAGGGGVSMAYSTPGWQSGDGVPVADPYSSSPDQHHRYLPDVSLTAASHDGYVICQADDPALGGQCTKDSSNQPVKYRSVGGTSAAAPAFAGLMALVNQATGAIQGNPNYHFYRLAVLRPEVYHDIQQGNDEVPCASGSPNCSIGGTPAGTALYYMVGHPAGPGYDLATGLGSVDAYNLVTLWHSVDSPTVSFPTKTTLTASAYSIAPSSSSALTATVTGSRLPSSPLGYVLFHLGSETGPILNRGDLPSSTGGIATVTATVLASQLQPGSNNIYAVYSGDAADDAPSSAMVTIVVSSSASKVATTTALTPSATQVTQGAPLTFTAKVQPQSGSGSPSGTVTFNDGTTQLGKSTLDNTGTAVLTISSLATGAHLMTASYAGDQNFSASASSNVSVTVSAVHPVIAVSPGTGAFGITPFQKSGSGFTPNGTITQRVTYPDTTLNTVTRAADAFGNYNYSITYSNQIGKYFQTDTDNQSGQPSNTSSWTVTAPVLNDFSVLPSPTSQSVSQGGSVGFNVQTTTTSGSAQAVAFTISNWPSGLSAMFTPTPVTSGDAANLTISASSTAPTGTYTLTIAGAGSTTTHTAQISITIVQSAGGPVVTMNPTIVRFNSQAVGSVSAPENVMLINNVNGSGPLTISNVVVSGDFVLLSPPTTPIILNPLVPLVFRVAFEPTAPGTRTGQLFVYDSAPNSPQIVSLTGTASAAAPNTGTINVAATLNGIALPSGYPYSYSLSGPATYTGGGAYSFAAQPGTYTMNFGGTSGLTLASVTPSATQSVTAGNTITFTLNFTAPNDFYAPEFSFPSGGVTPQVVKAGSAATYTVGIYLPAGIASIPITLSVVGIPPSASAVFNPQPLLSGQDANLTVNTTASTPPGTYTLTLSGTNSSGLVHGGNTSSLVVTAPGPLPVQLVSTNTTGNTANAASNIVLGAANSDGRYIVFQTSATNLTPGDSSAWQEVYVRDRQLGTTALVSVSSGGFLANCGSAGATISADGRYVAFRSCADNLYTGSTNGKNGIYVRDLFQGNTEREDISAVGSVANGSGSIAPKITADGRFVLFESDATNLVPGTSGSQAYVRDRKTGTITLASAATDGTPANAAVRGTGISADGRFVGFTSSATDLVAQNIGGMPQAFLKDLATGSVVLISVAPDGSAANSSVLNNSSSGSYAPLAISADGRFVLFNSQATNLVPQIINGVGVFVRDTWTGQTKLINVDSVGVPLGGWNSFIAAAMSADGRFVSFRGFSQVLIRDTVANQTAVVSLAPDGSGDNSVSVATPADTVVAPGGTLIAFGSTGTNLVTANTGGVNNIFVAQNPFTAVSRAQSLVLAAPTIAGGSSSTATVTLSAPAPTGGASVTVWTNNSAAQLPSTVVVPAGSTSVPITISTSLVPNETVLTVLAAYGGGSAASILTLEPTGQLSVSPTNWDFGDQSVGTTSPPATFTISNQGSATLSGLTVTLGSGQLFKITSNTCGGSVPAGGACSASVTFGPAIAGLQSDTLIIGYGTSGNSQSISLSGNGAQPIPVIAPTQAQFGTQTVATTSFSAATLGNSGNAPLAVVSATITGPNAGDFSKSSDTCTGTTLPPNSNCVVVVAFSPAATGPRTAVLQLVVNAPNSPLQVSLSGTGTNVAATTTTLTASPNPATVGTSVVFTGTVTTTGSQAPTGTLAFKDGSVTLGTGALNASGTATYTTASLSAGTHTITASYGGDANNGPSTSTTISEVIQDFTLPSTIPSITVVAGQSTTQTITVSPQSGFSGTVTFACSVPANMTEASCSATSVQITSASAVNSTVTITTTAPHHVAALRRHSNWLLAQVGGIFCGIVLLGFPCLRRKRIALIGLLLAALLILNLSACGGSSGSNSGAGSGSTDPGTPAGTYVLTLTATSGVTSHIINLSVTVQ